MRKNQYTQKGFTLIALIVTCIVLVILAGISVSMISSDNALLVRTARMKKETIVGKEKEEIEMAYDAALSGNIGTMTVSEGEFESELNKYEGENRVEVTKIGENMFRIRFKVTGHEYLKTSNGIENIQV